MTEFSDHVTVVRRNPDGTESRSEIGPCSMAPVGTPFDGPGWREIGTVAEPVQFQRTESDILAAIDQLERDEIDELVDLQLRQPMSGYDHNINQPTCIHCGGDAHSVPITQRMQQMRQLFARTVQYYEDGLRASDELIAQLDAYRYNEDDSEIVCPGSEFIGAPKPPRWKLEERRRAVERERTIDEYLAGDPSYEKLRGAAQVGIYTGPMERLGCFYAGLPLPDLTEDVSLWVTVPFGPLARMSSVRLNVDQIADGFRQIGQQVREALTPVADAFTAVARSMDLWSFTLPEVVQFPRPFTTWTRPSISEWTERLYTLNRELQMHLYRNAAVVLMPDEPRHSRRLEAVLGMPIRYAAVAEGYVGYLHEASESGMGSAMCDYLTLERAGTEPVIVASREAVELALRSERSFYEPLRVDFRDVSPTAPIPAPRRFAELRTMRIQELDSLDYIIVGYRMDVPSADDIARELDPVFPERQGISLRADMAAFRAPEVPDESFADPPSTNRRQRRGQRESSVPMWTRALNGRRSSR